MSSAAGGADAGVPAARSARIEEGQTVDLLQYNERWHQIWKAGLPPGTRFDAGAASPALRALLRDALPAAGARVLVPGCGRGYDVIEAAAAGAALAVGLDISPEAVAAAAAHRDAAAPRDVAARAEFAAADFFEYQHAGGPFDIGYDYTFLCALPPGDTRRKWAAAWARHLKPGGELVTLIFPVDPAADPSLGPPFPVTPELYSSLLLPAGFECVELSRLSDELSHPARAGREWLGRWRAPGGGGSGGGGGMGGAGAAASKF